mgnify:CR=1 FL=1
MDSNRLILIILASVSLLLIAPKLKKYSFGLIVMTILVGFSVTKDIVLSICVALILGSIFASLCSIPSRPIPREFFKSGNGSSKKKKNKKKLSKKDREDEEQEEDGEDQEDEEEEEDGEDTKEDYEDEDEDEEEEDDEDEDDGEEDEDVEEEFNLDSKGSFYENYQSLTPKQVKGLNKDTRNLIKTQKSLIETLNNMGPALKDGRQILDTFKNYFGSEQDIGAAMKNFKA